MPEASTGLKSFTVLPLQISEPSTACFIWAFEPSYTGTFWANHLVGPSCSCSCSRLVVPNRSPICGDGARSSFTELHFVPPRHFTPVLESKKYCADLEQLFTTFVNIFSIGGDDAFPNTFPFYTLIYKLMGSERCDPSDIFVNLMSKTFWMRIVNSSTIMQFTFLQ